MAKKSKSPDLSIVPPAEEPAPPVEPPKPPTVTIAQRIETYAVLVKRLKRTYQLNEATIVRLAELTLNEHFTLLQMGLARPSNPVPTEEPDGNSSED